MRIWLIICACSLALSVRGQSSQPAENVFLITLDGLRWQELFFGADSALISEKDYVKNVEELNHLFWKASSQARRQALMPFFWEVIAQEGQLHGNRTLGSKVNCVNQQWFSYPGYNEILSGVADDQRITSNDKIPNPNLTVLEYLNSLDDFKGKVAAFGSWDVFSYIVNEQRSGVPVNAGFEENPTPASNNEKILNLLQSQIPSPWSTVRFDAFTHHYALEYIKKHLPKVVYIAYGETDDFAHDGQYDAYLKSTRQTDAFIEELWEFVQSQAHYKDKTTFIVTTDHGRGTIPKDSWRSHGIKIEGADQIWIALLGANVQALGEVAQDQQLYQNQIAATVAALLGKTFDGEPVGKAIRLTVDD